VITTNLPRPGGPREADSPHPAAGPAEITPIYGILDWIDPHPPPQVVQDITAAVRDRGHELQARGR
jgi:hypothetical protein